MDLQLVERENLLLGQDYLTWLWYRIDTQNGMFKSDDGQSYVLDMENRISVQGGEGESLETATVSSPRGELAEAKTGLKTGKKVARAQLKFEVNQDSWQVQVKAQDFGLTGLKPPKIDSADKDDDPDALFLEKMFLIEKCLELLDETFVKFVGLRTGPKWREEADKIKEWIARD